MLLDHRNRGQTVARAIHTGEAFVVRDPQQLPVRTVRPGVVGADEALAIAGALARPGTRGAGTR